MASIYSSWGSSVGSVRGSTIYNSADQIVGSFSWGTIYNSSGSCVGSVRGDDIYNSAGSRIGYISWGRIYNSAGSCVGSYSGCGAGEAGAAARLLGLL